MKILTALLLSFGFISQIGYASSSCGSMDGKTLWASSNPAGNDTATSRPRTTRPVRKAVKSSAQR